jgi:hypothetical protein
LQKNKRRFWFWLPGCETAHRISNAWAGWPCPKVWLVCLSSKRSLPSLPYRIPCNVWSGTLVSMRTRSPSTGPSTVLRRHPHRRLYAQTTCPMRHRQNQYPIHARPKRSLTRLCSGCGFWSTSWRDHSSSSPRRQTTRSESDYLTFPVEYQ